MAQDLGSAILAGFQGVQAATQRRQQLGIQREELELARGRAGREERQLGILESDFKLRQEKQASDLRTARLSEIGTKVKREGDSLIGDALSLGYYDVNNRETPFKKDKLIADLQGSDPAKKAEAQRFMLRIANHERAMGKFEEGNIDEDDFSFDSLDEQALATGKVIAVGRYRSTGEPGVSTVRGTNEPDDPVYSRNFADSASDISVYWRGSVLNRGSNMGASSAYTRSTVVGLTAEADSGRGARGDDVVGATNRVTSDVMSSAAPILGREGKRAAVAALSAAEDNPAEYRRVLLGITETLNRGGANIQVPSILTAPVDKNERDKNIVEPKVYGADNTFDPAVIASNPAPSGAGVAATLMATSRSTPVASLDKKIADATSKADKATGDARIAAENELSKLQQQRYDLVNNINVRQFNDINSQLASLQSDRAKASPDRRAAFDSKISDLTKRRDLYVKAGYRTPSMETDAYKALETNVLSKLEGLTGEQALQLVQDGRIQFSEADMAAMRARAQEAGVTSNAQVKRLPLREQTALRVIMYSWSDNPQERESIRQELTNIAETGILSMSKKDLDTSQRGWFTAYTDRMRLDQNRAEFLYRASQDRSNALNEALKRKDGWDKSAKDALTGMTRMIRFGKGPDGADIDDAGYDDGKLNRTRVDAAVKFYLPNLVLDARQAIQEGSGKRHLQTLNALTSTALMAAAKDGTGGFWNWVGSWGNPSPDQIIGAGTDFGLQRVKAEKDANDNITGFRVYSAGGGRAGRFFSAKQVQDQMDPEMYKVVVSAIELNELARQSKDPNAR
jgi:hypothetical protein